MKRKELKKIEIIKKENKVNNILPLYPQYFEENKVYVDWILEGIEDDKIMQQSIQLRRGDITK